MCRWNCPRNGNSDTLHFALPVAAAAVAVVIVYPFCHIYLVGLEAAVVGEREAKGVRDAGPVISIYNLILSNDNDDDNNSSNLQPATCNNNNNESSAAAIKTLPLQSPDKLVLMAAAEPSQGPQQRRSPDPNLHSLLSSLQSAVCDLSRLRFGLHSELGLGLALGLRFSLWLRYCKPRTERQSS